MVSKEEIERSPNVYIDTSLLIGWFKKLMKQEDPGEPRIFEFLREHPEIKAFISPFTIAEIVEVFLHSKVSEEIRPHMKNYEMIKKFTETLLRTTGLNVLKYENNGKKGFFMSHRVADYTSLGGSVKDATHICIAEHEDLWFITHDSKIPKIEPLYKKILTDTHLVKIFEKN